MSDFNGNAKEKERSKMGPLEDINSSFPLRQTLKKAREAVRLSSRGAPAFSERWSSGRCQGR